MDDKQQSRPTVADRHPLAAPARQPDQRSRRSEAALKEAFVELVNQKPPESLTVQEIVTSAGVNRATFYRHFLDRDDLAERVWSDALDELLTRLGPPVEDLGRADQRRVLDAFEGLYEHVGRHGRLYRALFRGLANGQSARRMSDHAQTLVLARMRMVGRRGRSGTVPDQVALSFMTSALLGSLTWWLDLDERPAARQMATWLLRFADLGYYRSMGFESLGEIS